MAPPPSASSPAPAAETVKGAEASKVAAAPSDPFAVVHAQLLSDVLLLERSVLLKDARLTARVLRSSARLRRSLHPSPASSSPPSSLPTPSPSSPVDSLAAFFAVVQGLSCAARGLRLHSPSPVRLPYPLSAAAQGRRGG